MPSETSNTPAGWSPRAWTMVWWVPRVLFVGFACFLMLAASRGYSSSGLKSAVILFVLSTVLLVGRQIWWRREGPKIDPKLKDSRGLVVLGGVLCILGVFLLIGSHLSDESDELWVFGGLFVVLGVGWLVEVWRQRSPAELRMDLWGWGLALLVLGIGAGVIGWVGLKRAGAGISAPIVWFGVALVLIWVAVGLLSEGGLRWFGSARTTGRLSRVRRRAPVVARALLFLGLLVIWWFAAAGWGFAAALSVLVLVLILGIVSNTHLDVAMVLVGVALLGAAPAEVRAPPDLTEATATTTLLSLGDSYMSGEGASTYFAGTDDAGGNECRRAPTAYAVKMVEATDANPGHVVFLACSGARTTNFVPDADPNDAVVAPQKGEPATQVDQVAKLRTDFPSFPELVVVSLGGNDAGFGAIAQACLLGDCTTQAERFTANLPAVEKALVASYSALASRLPGVRILAVPYPQPFAKGKECSDVFLSEAERDFVRDFIDDLDARVETAASQVPGVEYVAEMKDSLAMANLQLCQVPTSEAGLNFIDLKSKNGLASQRFNPTLWLHNSLHPNERGHEAMRNTLKRWLDNNAPEKNSAVTGAVQELNPNVVVQRAAKINPQCSLTESSESKCQTDVRVWELNQLARNVPWFILTVLLLLLWVVCIAALSVGTEASLN